jgi:glycine hydroxymethyltransferase
MNNYTINSLPLSLKRQALISKNSLILNPTENTPFRNSLHDIDFLHSFYISDTQRSSLDQKNSLIQFSGRGRATYDINLIYKTWAKYLNAEDLSMRLLSGLHAHIILFMGLGNVGEKVLLLPESAGGHFATKSIIERLGYEVIELVVDSDNRCIDLEENLKLIKEHKPNYLFIDRSEGIVYEDFSKLVKQSGIYSIFDASQYLTHILARDYKSPFDMGFNLIVSTIHKNFPGPQKAIVFTNKKDLMWNKVKKSMSAYVSSQHSFNTYGAGLSFINIEEIKNMSTIMLNNANALRQELINNGLPAVMVNNNFVATQHIWIKINNKEKAFKFFKNMEKMRLLVNYRLLPYGLGYGIRIGTAAATKDGLKIEHIPKLSSYIAKIYYGDNSLELKHLIRSFIQKIKE